VFTHFLLRAFRGEADSGDGAITARDLYEFVYNSTKDATQGKQHPQMYSAKGRKDPTIVFKAAKFADTLNIKGQFFYEDDNGRVRPLNPGDTLQSGQKVGISFESESDCFVYIFWWDTNGKVGQLFPNPELTEGTGEVKAGRTYWLPSLRGDRWYMLDLSPGTETLYFVASREKNPDIEQLSGKLLNAKGSQANRAIGQQLEHNFNLMSPIKVMGFSQQTAEKKGVGRAEASYDDKTSLFKDIEESVKVRGKDAQYKIEFTHK
jgi:hypothetical protein